MQTEPTLRFFAKERTTWVLTLNSLNTLISSLSLLQNTQGTLASSSSSKKAVNSIRLKGSKAPLAYARSLQVGQVQGGGGGFAKLVYTSTISTMMSMPPGGASALMTGTAVVKGSGSGSIIGPNGMAVAGGRGGGNISGAIDFYAFNGGDVIGGGGGLVGGFGGGSAQFNPGMNAPTGLTAPGDLSTGGGGAASAFSQGLGFANVTAPKIGSFARGNSTGITTAYGIGYGIGSNSLGIGGGNAAVLVNGEGGGNAIVGEAPVGGSAGNADGGRVDFLGISNNAATAAAGGYTGVIPKVATPYLPAFTIPTFDGIFTIPTP